MAGGRRTLTHTYFVYATRHMHILIKIRNLMKTRNVTIAERNYHSEAYFVCKRPGTHRISFMKENWKSPFMIYDSDRVCASKLGCFYLYVCMPAIVLYASMFSCVRFRLRAPDFFHSAIGICCWLKLFYFYTNNA